MLFRVTFDSASIECNHLSTKSSTLYYTVYAYNIVLCGTYPRQTNTHIYTHQHTPTHTCMYIHIRTCEDVQ